MNLVIDIGNTHTKIGWFEGTTLRRQDRLVHRSEVADLLRQPPSVAAVMISSVAGIPVAGNPVRFPAGTGTPVAGTPVADILSSLQLPERSVYTLDGSTPLPFVNTYLTPATLGTDRIAAVAGAQRWHPAQSVLVIDAGTCITYDVIDPAGVYRGGIISPGMQMRLRAMHTFTARLPLVALNRPADDPLAGPGEESPQVIASSLDQVRPLSSSSAAHRLTERDTEAGLRSGAVRGAAAEISQMIRMYADKFSDLHVILCGGDASYLLPYVYQDRPIPPERITEVAALILIGLNCILQHNVNQQK